MKKFFISLFLVLVSVVLVVQLQPTKIKYVFLIIGDGMSMSSEVSASEFLYGKDKQLCWNQFPEQLFMTTWSLSSYDGDYDKNNVDSNKGYNIEVAGALPYPYYKSEDAEKYFRDSTPTDSSAAATAMATGQKVDNDSICYDKREDKFINNIVDKINETKKYNVAIMTTDALYGATPAGFSSHNKTRHNEKEIAEEIFSKTKPKIVVGKNYIDEINDFAKDNGYTVLNLEEIYKSQVTDLTGKQIFINLNKYHVPYPQENFSTEPFKYDNGLKFSDAVLYAIKNLLSDKKPFFSLIEVGDIDKNNHENNYLGMLGAMYELNETVKNICNLINSKTTDMTFKNTLIIVTADHSTGFLRFDGGYLGKGKFPTKELVYDEETKTEIEVDKEVGYRSDGHVNELVGFYVINKKLNMLDKYVNDKNIIDNTNIFNILDDVINN